MVGCMKKKFLSGLMLLGILLFVIIIISIPNLWPCVLFFLKPFESDNRPEVLTLFVTIIMIQLIYELEQLIYEHVDITDKQDKKNFIARTTEIILEMRELVYGLNSIYMCEDQRKVFPINSEKFKRATMILKDIEEFRMSLYKYTDLKKIQGVA